MPDLVRERGSADEKGCGHLAQRFQLPEPARSKIQAQTGHGGVPLGIFQGEPFFGQDRFNQFYWRLRQSRLTERREPRGFRRAPDPTRYD